nr:hypothetical protein [Tanacetum cinerariifolium]
MVTFIKELGYTGKCDMPYEIHTDHMHQPWRTFDVVINRCISEKSTCVDRLRPSRAQILWGMFYQKNVNYVALQWEDFMFQADNRETHFARKENMPYPRFTKLYGDLNISLNDVEPADKEKGNVKMTNTKTGDAELKNLYGDLNISLNDVEPADKEKGNVKMTNTKTGDAELKNVNQEGTEDEDAMDEGVADKLKKRKHDDTDKDKGPFARSDRGKSIEFWPPQTWISKIAQAKPPISFDELMSTPIDFSAYVMNHLKIDKLTQEHLIGPTFNLLKGKEYPFDHSKPLPLIMVQGRQVVHVDYFIINDLEYLRGGSSSKKYTTSTTKTKDAKYDIPGIEDMAPSL